PHSSGPKLLFDHLRKSIQLMHKANRGLRLSRLMTTAIQHKDHLSIIRGMNHSPRSKLHNLFRQRESGGTREGTRQTLIGQPDNVLSVDKVRRQVTSIAYSSTDRHLLVNVVQMVEQHPA